MSKLKVVCLYSPSHKDMMDKFFIPSLPENIELKIVEAPQTAGETPSFNSPEWKSFMYIKAKLLLDEVLNIPENAFYLFLDVDIICVQDFVDFITTEMEGMDFVCQSDSFHPQVLNCCTGVIALRNTPVTRNLLQAMNVYLNSFAQEQEAFTYFVANHSKYEELQGLRYKLLDKNNAFSYGLLTGQVWTGKEEFDLPSKDDLYFVHANYAHHEAKVPLLEKFKEKLS